MDSNVRLLNCYMDTIAYVIVSVVENRNEDSYVYPVLKLMTTFTLWLCDLHVDANMHSSLSFRLLVCSLN